MSRQEHRWLRWLLALAVFVGLTGCGPIEAPTKPGQDFVVEVVWQQQYRQPADTVPTIYWMEGDVLNCDNGSGWVPPPGATKYACVAGLYYDDTRTAYIAWPAGADAFSSPLVPFAHELCHSYMWRAYGYGDVDHTGPCFVDTAGAPAYVTTANEGLAWLGL